MVLLRKQVVEEAGLAHELKGARIKACHDGVAPAAGRGNVVSVDGCGLASAHRCDMANCMRRTISSATSLPQAQVLA